MTRTESAQSVRYLEAPAAELRARQAATALRNWLRANTVFSVTTGTIGVALGDPVADLLGIDQPWLVRLLGAALIMFALAVFAVSGATATTLTTWSAEISLADFGWVAGTALVVALGWLSTAGAIVLTVIGAAVFGLGLAQLIARRRLMTAVDETEAAL